jgi:hypothetical protein
LTAAVIVALLLIGSPFLLAFHTLRRSQELEALAEATDGISQVVVDSLRSAMLAGEPHLMDEAVRRIVDQEQVERVLLLDHRPQLQVSADEASEGRGVDRHPDPTCSVCHGSEAASPHSRTVVTHEEGRRVLRSMTTIRNEPQCHACHDPANAINGVLVMDFALGAADNRFFADIGRTVALGAVMLLLTVALLSRETSTPRRSSRERASSPSSPRRSTT